MIELTILQNVIIFATATNRGRAIASLQQVCSRSRSRSNDELEKRTGIDFFCNLPDDVEKTVEAETDLDFWKLTVTP